LISLTVDAFQRLFPPFETTFQTDMAEWRLDEQPRTARRGPEGPELPLPAPEERLLWILIYPKTPPLQVVQGSGWARVKPIGGFISCWGPAGDAARGGMLPHGP
jgi:hypothetical protein